MRAAATRPEPHGRDAQLADAFADRCGLGHSDARGWLPPQWPVALGYVKLSATEDEDEDEEYVC